VAEKSSSFFLFANALLSHTGDSLGEALKAIPKLIESGGGADRGRGEFLELRRNIRNHLCLVNQSVPFLVSLATGGKGGNAELERSRLALLDPLLLPRLGTLVAQCLFTLTSPSRGKLLIMGDEEARALVWRPKALIEGLLQLAIGLFDQGRGSGWARALAGGGLMESGVWESVVGVSERLGLTGLDAGELKALGFAGKACVEDNKVSEALALVAPEEFLDPLLSVVMLDPVRAGPHGRVFDRVSIVQQILTDPRDPYSRTPLSPEDLIPLPELKAKIKAWVEEKALTITDL